ncbi:PREDICTED: uncharacterized protein LOC109228059 [Nicotiana attenuata]|uniref:uncharacterized protein LOC109228059 n=1 Tax=Nicotiana attenuata TaxID=49451 RepID=UPI000904E596|nr:PREDICTED: uncharacterized protein LOC109228059 [Nicotiana attenuata]
MSTEWSESIYAKEALGKEVVRFIVSPYFWNDTVQALKVGSPLVTVLRLVDGERKPPMGYIYEAMDRAKETIEKAFDHYRRKYERVFEIIDKRWTDQLNQPLHAAGHILNPEFFYKNNEKKTLDIDVWKGYHACVAKLVPDEAMQDKIGEELVEWWMQFGYEVPNLQQFAIRIRSLTCSSSGCERNWSVYEHIHTKKRNRLELKKLNDLVFVKYNRTLARRYKARNIIDPVLLDNIDEANEWLTGAVENHEEEEVFEGEGLTFGHVAMASGVEENIYGFTGSTLRSKERVSTSTSTCTSRTLIDEVSDEEEENDDQYNNSNMMTLQKFGDLVAPFVILFCICLICYDF